MKLNRIIEGISALTTRSTGESLNVPGRIADSGDGCTDWKDEPGKQLLLEKSATDFMWVNSDSMAGAGIHSGDMIIIDRSLKAASGKIVLALLNGEMLVRRFEKVLNKIRLVPGTDKLAPIDIDGNYEEFSVCGVVTHVIRPLG